jgi:hypothetical protein
MPKPSTECAVVDCATDLEQQIGAPSRPSHLLQFIHAPVDQEVRCALGDRRSNAQAGSISFGIVDQLCGLAAEVFGDRMQRMPQLARRHAPRALAVLAFENMHDLADPLDAALGILRLAILNPPMQTFDLGGDRRLRLHPVRIVRRQVRSRQLSVLQTHRDMKPVQNRRFRYTRVGQNRTQTRTTVSESGHLGGVSPAHGFQGPLDQRGDVGLGPGYGAKDLAATVNRLDVADADLQMVCSPSSRLRMKVESKLIVIAGAAADGFSDAASASRSPTCSVWLRNVSGLVPASIGNRCCITSAATRYGISADSRACSWFSSGVDRQCDGQLTSVSPQPQPAHTSRGSLTLTSPNNVAIRCGCQSFT